MKRLGKGAILASALAAAIAMAPVSADAHKIHHKHHFKGGPHGNGLTALQWYVTGGMFCSSLWLILHSAYVSNTEHRELTYREAYRDVAGCWLPIAGPWIVDQSLPPQY
jgi:hypothetical protein